MPSSEDMCDDIDDLRDEQEDRFLVRMAKSLAAAIEDDMRGELDGLVDVVVTFDGPRASFPGFGPPSESE